MKKYYLNYMFALVILVTASLVVYSCKKDPIREPPQSVIDAAAIVDYAKDNQLDGKFTDSGLYYKIIEPGSADHPNSSSEITADYIGYRLNGDILEADTSFTYQLNELIYGWQQGIRLIGSGGKIILIIPSHLAYGSDPTKNASYSILRYNITLISFTN